MPKHSQHTWNESNIVDDVQFQEKDAEIFKNLLTQREVVSSEESPLMTPGTILKGRRIFRSFSSLFRL
jgi:small subunit ribosomal protein S1